MESYKTLLLYTLLFVSVSAILACFVGDVLENKLHNLYKKWRELN